MNVITKSGNLAPYLRATTQVVASNIKATAAVNPAGELSVAKTFDIVKTSANNAIAAQNVVVGGKFCICAVNSSAQNAFFHASSLELRLFLFEKLPSECYVTNTLYIFDLYFDSCKPSATLFNIAS